MLAGLCARRLRGPVLPIITLRESGFGFQISYSIHVSSLILLLYLITIVFLGGLRPFGRLQAPRAGAHMLHNRNRIATAHTDLRFAQASEEQL